MARIHDLTPDQRALVLLLRHEFGYSYREIALKTKMSKTSVFRIIKHFDCSNTRGKKLKKAYQGRHKSLTERDERKLKRAIMQLRERSPNFTVMEVVQRSGISPTIVTYRTFLQYVKRLGYGFFQSLKKGVLTKKDLKIRRKFARNMKSKPKIIGRQMLHSIWTAFLSFTKVIQ